MNSELEVLVLAFDAFFEGSAADSKQLRRFYFSRLEEVAGRSNLNVTALDKLVRYKHKKWKMAQSKKPSTMPPRS
jgi:hypothetical protein